MCCAHAAEDPDRLTGLIHRHFGYYIRNNRHKKVPKSWGDGHLYYYPAERIAWIVAVLSILMSTVLLIGAVAVIYVVKGKGARVGILAGGFCYECWPVNQCEEGRDLWVDCCVSSYCVKK
jgi:hypothetical protein